MQKDFENENLRTIDENDTGTYYNLVELSHINEKPKKNKNRKCLYCFLYTIFGVLLFLFILLLLFDKNSYLTKKLANNEIIRKYFLSKLAGTDIKGDSAKTNEVIGQTKEDINQMKEDIHKAKEDSKHSKEDLDKLKEELKKAKEEANKEKEVVNKLKEDLDKTKEELNKIKEGLGDKIDYKVKYYTPESYGEKKLEISFDYKDAIKAQLDKKLDDSKINSFPKDRLKFALCTIGKLENLYARDFVLYYLELGVKKIYIYDNNEKNGENSKMFYRI